jgi:hypothetical protein
VTGRPGQGAVGADPAALRAYVRVTREVDQDLLSLATGSLHASMEEFRMRCPEAARNIPEVDRSLADLATRCLRLSDMVEQVAADFEAAGRGQGLRDLLLPEVAGDLGPLHALAADGTPLSSSPVGQVADLAVEVPPTAPDPEPHSSGLAAGAVGDFVNGAWDDIHGTVEGVLDAARHPEDAVQGMLGMIQHPLDALRALVDGDDLESGHLARWAGHLAPGAVLGAVTDGGGFLIRVFTVLRRFAREAKAVSATARTLAQELGEGEARLLMTRLGREATDEMVTAMTPSEIRRFVDALGPARVRELAERYGAQAMRYYGAEFFKEYRGVTDSTMKHVVRGDGITKGEIKGCHDRAAFLATIHGNGEVVRELTSRDNPSISHIEYRLYKRNLDSTVAQPLRLSDGGIKEKTVIRGLTPDQWRSLATEAADDAIRSMKLPVRGGRFKAETSLGPVVGYYKPPMIVTLFPDF